MPKNIKFIIAIEDENQRLDKFLALQLPDFSRSEIQKFKVVKIQNDKKHNVKFSEKVKPDEVYEVEIPAKNENDNLLPEASQDFKLDIIFQDDDIIVINKPRGVVMYPSAGNFSGTLVQNVLSITSLSSLGGNNRPGVVHRLDKDTSGVVIMAKTDEAFKGLIESFSTQEVTRQYVAFVWGIPNWESADITGNITRSTKNRQKMTMVQMGGRHAHTEVMVRKIWPKEKISEIQCNLFTGRTHQIRVHLSNHGFPVLCDTVYGRGSSRLGSVKNPDLYHFLKTSKGQMLHAEKVEIKHPLTGKKIKFKAPWPSDIERLKELLGQII